MTMRIAIRRFPACQNGASAAEFALVLPILLLFLFGIIDIGRLMWTLNGAEKATQMGARAAIVSNYVPGGLASKDYGADLGQGAAIPLSQFGAARCTKPLGTVTCNCTTTPCPTLTPTNSDTFNAIVTRMRSIAPAIAETDVRITYTNSGLGYAGDPNGADVAPLVTVDAVGIDFTPLLFQFFGASFNLPTISATLTMEDGEGAVTESN
ncbi:TadE/TadG family type IV pilus assembly protein [Sphingorhabdus pulchriflava]|nr:TadE/TadG family type IV pilus assembly protein [Sphingorhabdus pulchriflava]